MASLSNRYSEALFQVVEAEGVVADVDADLRILAPQFEAVELRRLLQSPDVTDAQKREVLAKAIEAGGRTAHARTLRFLEVVLRKGRQSLLADMIRAFHARALQSRGEVEGTVESALPLEADDLEAIAGALGKQVGKTVRLIPRVDEDLLGGFRVLIGGTLYDQSLRGQIENLGRKLKGLPLGAFLGPHE